ncbi:hypothetical protein NUW58_g9809 [Xylaria curta]|uniref:Uncharacterized protein n=1 Tax=Xylaria curta TaxID=42375 RepID=A0ACC1MST8_9PEZI|nr:hypothetical protein NUW58_g9809 [Xylaria curta]
MDSFGNPYPESLPTLPSVEAVRPPRGVRKGPIYTPFSLLDSVKYYTGTDHELIWGPFYKRFRALRRGRGHSEGFDLTSMWDGIPETSQTRPGSIARFFNWVVGANPPPTLTFPRSTKAGQRPPPSPKARRVGSWQQAVRLNEDWSPSQIDFAQWYGRIKHPADYDDEFYKAHYETLYLKLCDFAESWFGFGIWLEDFRDGKEEVSTWEATMTEQFIQYASVVAHEDRGYVDWKDILNDPKHRKWLCVGIFAQIIERKIFNSLLFGAPEYYQSELDRHDTQWRWEEGFTRKEGRRQLVRCSLGEGLVPSDFWDAVDDLAGQTVLVFQPLFMLMCMASNRPAKHYGAIFWQEVHSLLAFAGYFQVCMAISPSIFHILSATPGSRFQWEEEKHADESLYTASKKFHKSHEDRWRMIAELSSKGEAAKVAVLSEQENDITNYMPFPSNESEYRIMDHARRRGGKVMYTVFPKLTRYTAENVGAIVLDIQPATSEEIMEEKSEGMRITMLQRGMVVYYQGLVHSPAELDDGVPLETHLNEISWNRMAGGIFPYWRHYWDSNGNPSCWIHWPVWPEAVNKYWLCWILYFIFAQVLKWHLGSYVQGEDLPLWEAYFYRSFVWLLVDAAVFVVARAYELPFFTGRFTWLKTQFLNIGLIPSPCI